MTHRSQTEVIQMLEGLDTTKHSAVLQEKLGELYAASGKPASAVHAYDQALQFGPSHLQELRLLLAQADKLTETGESAKAYASYETLLKEFTNYPDKLAILQKALPLARKLNKRRDVEYLEGEIKKLQPTK